MNYLIYFFFEILVFVNSRSIKTRLPRQVYPYNMGYNYNQMYPYNYNQMYPNNYNQMYPNNYNQMYPNNQYLMGEYGYGNMYPNMMMANAVGMNCRQNEVYQQCGQLCVQTCQNPAPTCPSICTPNMAGCTCILGNVRDLRTGMCVPQTSECGIGKR